MPDQSTKMTGEQVEAKTLIQEQIAALAYSLWEARGCPEGTPKEDWFNAEKALMADDI